MSGTSGVDPELAAIRSMGLFGMAFVYNGVVLDPAKVVLRMAGDGTDATSLRIENAQLRSLVNDLRIRQPSAAGLARRFHETYEALAPEFGYRTREDSAKPWDKVPQQNRNLMIATAQVIIDSWPLADAADDADVPAPCACLNWAGDIRVPRPNGHHPLCDGTGQHRVEQSEPPVSDLGGHVLLVHERGHHDHEEFARSCMFCDGGLSACTRCDAFEGAWPDECPGERMTQKQIDAVYAGQLNFRDGAWRPGECCQVRRPVHDLDAYMDERGYRRNAVGRWEQFREPRARSHKEP